MLKQTNQSPDASLNRDFTLQTIRINFKHKIIEDANRVGIIPEQVRALALQARKPGLRFLGEHDWILTYNSIHVTRAGRNRRVSRAT